MFVKDLEFINFRNLTNGKIEADRNVNVICGNNAQGKTNLLETIWLFCGGHSFRNSKENELIKFNEDFYKIILNFDSYGRTQNAEIRFHNGKKQIFINGIEKKTSSYLTEVFSAVVFFPDQLNLIKSSPAKRRNFLDTAICQQNIRYANILSKYYKVLKQRNTLLKDLYKHPEINDTVTIWNEYLVKFGSMIISERLKYITKLQETAKKYHSGISNNKEDLNLTYLSTISAQNVDNDEEIKEKFRNELENSLQDDIRTGSTNIGPHRDDIEIEINCVSAKAFASQGQQRSTVLSLKLAEAELLFEKNGERPVILLDDVLSELDVDRQEYLLNNIKDYQVFVTCCEMLDKKQLQNGKIIKVDNGVVS